MKLLLSALCASLIISPLSFADSVKDIKQEEAKLAQCGKCKKGGEGKKEEVKLA